MKGKYSQFFAIINKNGLDKADVVADFTEGRTASLSGLSVGEYAELMRRLQRYNQRPKDWQPKPGDAMRKKIISMARQMGWVKPHPNPLYRFEVVADMERIDNWCLKYGKFGKKLNDHTETELPVLVTIFEKVLTTYLEGINK